MPHLYSRIGFKALVTVVASLGTIAVSLALPTECVEGNVRVQFLDEDLVRLELKGPNGFENRVTFNVVNRTWNGPAIRKSVEGDRLLVQTRKLIVTIPRNAQTLDGLEVKSTDGKTIYAYNGLPKHAYLPGPATKFDAWVMPDSPRIVPPKWGAAAPPATTDLASTSGWDLGNDAPDVYVFANIGQGYLELRKDFLKLTGPTPMPPRYLFGFIDSRYHPYTEKEALDTIDEYRKLEIPLDVFVVDTDWRVNGSHGYEISKQHFPDMARFMAEAHKRNVRLMYNDHPEPISDQATDPKELAYRAEGLTSLLKIGLDVWWYDRNWGTHIKTPARGLPLEVWGMRVYTDITQQFAPQLRPTVMTNVWGIDNGYRNGNTYAAMHRYPIWWTGDTGSTYDYLKKGIENGVDLGILSSLPYVNEDLGGHTGQPDAELYTRFLQYGCFSPITRIHCTLGRDRHPWIYGGETEEIVGQYIKLRYRLLPTIYTAARRAYDDGTPLLRRCDLEWPQFEEAADPTQFLFADDLLVAPVYDGQNSKFEVIPSNFFGTENKPGIQASFYNNTELEGEPVAIRTDANIDFDWHGEAPVSGVGKEDYSVRWQGSIGPAPESGEYTIFVRADDGVRLWIGDRKLVDAWVPQDNVVQAVKVKLEKGALYQLRLEYFQKGGQAKCTLGWRLPSQTKPIQRTLWVPPGQWTDLWTGQAYAGPSKITLDTPVWKMPLLAREGGIIVLGPDVQYSDQKPLDRVTVDAFVPTKNLSTTREFYEDDGKTINYQSNAFRRTKLQMKRTGKQIEFMISKPEGTFNGAVDKRMWTIRLHLPKDCVPKNRKGDANVVVYETGKKTNTIRDIPLTETTTIPSPDEGVLVVFTTKMESVNKPIKVTLNLK